MSYSKLSTKSASKHCMTHISSVKRDFVISGEFLSGKSDHSLDLSSSIDDRESFTIKAMGNRELDLIADLEALDASVIPSDSKSVSIIKDFHEEDEKDEFLKEEPFSRPRPLILENSQIKQKWWCANCIALEEPTRAICSIL